MPAFKEECKEKLASLTSKGIVIKAGEFQRINIYRAGGEQYGNAAV